MNYQLQPLKSIHLHSKYSFELEENGDIKTVYFLVFITALILLSAWINYINLFTAISVERTKEIGIRKVVGALRSNLISQFLAESALFNITAVILALSIVKISLSFFSQFTGIPDYFMLWNLKNFWVILVIMCTIGIFSSGLYPAFVISSFRAVTALKGKLIENSRSNILKKCLVIFQFAVSIALIAGTLTVYRQIQFMKNQELGIDINSTVVIKAPGVFNTSSASANVNKVSAFKTALNNMPAVNKSAVSSFVPGEYVLNIHGARRLYEPLEKAKEFHILSIDQDYLNLYKIDLLAGRNFSDDYSADREKIIINEAALPLLNFNNPEDAVGEKIYLETAQLEILGVAKNFHQQSLKYDYVPLVIHNAAFRGGNFSVKIQTDDLPVTITSIKNVWEEFFPGNPFDYFFLDEHFNRQYNTDMKFGQVSGLFTFLAILIGSLGLFGLVSLNLSIRTKEIGIRKTLGASIFSIIILLIRDFMKLIIAAVVIALPVSYFYYNNWLTNYAFRTDLGWWFFIIPVILISIIVFLTVFFKVTKASLSNPVDSLRIE
ncbi:FtsX-like permease family protein [candidate division KSB1 bacterium]